MNPADLLQEKLSQFKGDLRKSKDAYKEKKITRQEHLIHLGNIYPKIKAFRHAISILKQNGISPTTKPEINPHTEGSLRSN